jgi:hypothetical protein
MKISKEDLQQIIKEEVEVVTEIFGKGTEAPNYSDTTSKIHTNSKLAGQPESWLRMSDRLKQMSRVWVDPEDGKMLELAGEILRSAVDQHNAESDAAMGISQE